ncbi:MAG: ribonuclease Z, partial [Planctomycetota bacterium]
MKLLCLGTAGYHPNAHRHTSCYFLPESGLVLDAGSGLFRLAEHIHTDFLDILLSHAHLDHIVGLTYLLDTLHQRAQAGQPIQRIRIFGEQAKLDAIQEHLFSELIFPVPLQAEWIPIDELKSFQAGGAHIAWRTQNHPGGSAGYR